MRGTQWPHRMRRIGRWPLRHSSGRAQRTSRAAAIGVKHPRSARLDRAQTCVRARTRISPATCRVLLCAELRSAEGAHDGPGRTTSDRVRKPIHHRTSRTFSSQGRTPQRTPSHLRCAMSSAMSPGYTNTTLSRRRPRSWGQRRRVSGSQLTLPTSQSAPLLLAQAFRKRAAARTWLPLRTKRRKLRGTRRGSRETPPFRPQRKRPFGLRRRGERSDELAPRSARADFRPAF